ncbi:MAG: hypothetical protein QW117_01705 [Candidatus Pacearchaeota archaeon]
MNKDRILEIIKTLKKEAKERKFDESVDLIINLKNFDVKKDSINIIINFPYAIKKPKVFAILNKKTSIIDSITKEDLNKYNDKKIIKKLVKSYDFFIVSNNLMPLVATKLGKFLGQAGKMPSPQLGITTNETEEEIKKILSLMERSVRIKSKEPSLKFVVGKRSMKDEEIAENIIKAINVIKEILPKKEQNIKNILIKLTMSKPIKL